MIDISSLVKTVDWVNEKLLFGETIPPEAGLEAARWIASQQGEMGAYRGMFAPTPTDFEQGIRTFTGERLVSASARHILGEEAARVVWLLGRQDPDVRVAYDQATAWMHETPDAFESGTFCCGRCTLAFWRHFWVGDFKNKEPLLRKGLQVMKESRLGNGQWRRFPFFYAIYALLDLDLEPAYAELKYAQPALERSLKHKRAGAFLRRRRMIVEKALEKVIDIQD
jgi:hypothetical protein